MNETAASKFRRLAPRFLRWTRTAYFDQRWFSDAVATAWESFAACQPDVVVGSSMGGAIAMNINAEDTPQVLVEPAWRAWWLLRFGEERCVGPATVIVYGDRDRTIFPQYSQRLTANGRPDDSGLVASLEQRLAGHLVGQDSCRVEGRLVLVRGEGHRCNGDAALRAILAGVEVLAGQAGSG